MKFVEPFSAISAEQQKTLNRFRNVFGLAYRRYADVAKAEVQAREAQIEAALEKVRSSSLAMHNSDELNEVVTVLLQKLKELGILIEMRTSNIIVFEDGEKDFTQWVASPMYDSSFSVRTPYFDNLILNDIWDVRQNGIEFYSKSYPFEIKNEVFRFLFEHSDFKNILPEEEKKIILDSKHYELAGAFQKHSAIGIAGYNGKLVTLEEEYIMKRFSKVFEQAYIRFLDLQKAEAQARGVQIEASLERVRARTMAMQHSLELLEVIRVVSQQLQQLDFRFDHVSFGVNNQAQDYHFWTSMAHTLEPQELNVPYINNPVFENIRKAQKEQLTFFTDILTPEENDQWTLHMLKFIGEDFLPEYVKSYIFNKSIARSVVISPNILLIIAKYKPIPYSEEQNDILKRFGQVFDQSYTRFLDLQKAEAQAREAQIEASLEKVRSRSLAMRKSDELKESGELLWNELSKLGIESLSSGYVIMDKEEKTGWIYAPNPATGKIADPLGVLHTETKEMQEVLSCWKKQVASSVVEMDEQETITHQTFIAEKSFLKDGTIAHWITAEQLIALSPKKLFLHNFNFKQGYLMIVGGNSLDDKEIELMLRFTKVFQQTYTRFLDLQKTEEQAREAQIEAALERVRSRTMAMQQSEELGDVATILFKEINHLAENLWVCGFVLCEQNRSEDEWWLSSETGFIPAFYIPNIGDATHENIYRGWKNGETYHTEQLEGEALKEHYEWLWKIPASRNIFENMITAGYPLPVWQKLHCAYFSRGYLVFITQVPCLQEQIFKRFAQVFDLTYTRFLDLQKAEAQTKEVIKRASVDRVRAEIASMRTTGDLERIQPLIWNELKTLGVPFVRCGVFIMDEEQQKVHTFLSTPEGRAIAAFRQPYNAPSISAMVDSWYKKEIYQQHWNEAQFIEFTTNLVQQGAVSSGESYLTEIRPTDLYLHFLPFLQGMLYAGNDAPLKEDELQSVQNLAEAFSTAYARYEDFNKLEAAKQQVDKTLTDLKQTQAQLVQSEKMASLGELTAGIAHEIQNPLNFVNNFSDVNRELLQELKDEVDKGNVDEIKAIANDVIDNEEKISFHGKRADAIVKGMLQHSRTSTGIKEPTDINALADEYLRLSYHGLRAKEKDFNSEMKTDFDENIGKINIIPQDIGRVLLNLYNNAFYAVTEKKKSTEAKYEPAVSVSTKKTDNKVTISVKDNGNGIPQNVVDKIFQPFFTTKPTGQGTGLGLSLSYDIVKAHGGEIKVETKEVEFTEFIINLPL
jgi:signal transduction histidine kinase